jgi:nitroreductase
LYSDRKRNVGALDPFLREHHIGLGCALENLMLAAAANGYAADLSLLPGNLESIPADPKPELVARIDLAVGTKSGSALYNAIPKRHTNRAPCDPRTALPHEFLDALGRMGSTDPEVKMFLFTGDIVRKKIVEISAEANIEVYSDPQISSSSEQWMRTDPRYIQKFRDGLTIDAFGLSSTATAVSKILPLSMLQWVTSREQKNGYSNLMLSAPLIGILAVRDRYNQECCLRVGRIWQRAHLLGTAWGVVGRPCNESVEIIDHERKLAKPPRGTARLGEVLGDTAWQPTFVFYMGYPTRAAHASPRRSIEDVVL